MVSNKIRELISNMNGERAYHLGNIYEVTNV
jgi:hypothetical protein